MEFAIFDCMPLDSRLRGNDEKYEGMEFNDLNYYKDVYKGKATRRGSPESIKQVTKKTRHAKVNLSMPRCCFIQMSDRSHDPSAQLLKRLMTNWAKMVIRIKATG